MQHRDASHAVEPDTRVDDLPLPKGTIQRMHKLSLWYLDDLTELSESELLSVPGFGVGTLELVRALLHSAGLELRE